MEQDNTSISWNSLPWKKFQRKSFRLQRKIYQAKHIKDYKSFTRLQKLLLRSRSVYYIFVRELANYYSSKGIFLSQKMKIKLVDDLHINFNRCKYFISNNIFKKSLVSLSLEYLKNDVVARIWKCILDLRRFQGIFIITKKSIQIVSEVLRITTVNDAYREKFKKVLNASKFNPLKLKESKYSTLSLKAPPNYKINVSRIWKLFSEFYLFSKFLIKSNILGHEESKSVDGFKQT
jgi:hypothetical protein